MKRVFVAEDIRHGELVFRIDNSRIITDDHPLDPGKGEFNNHCDYLADGNIVLMPEPEMKINHCCEPNIYIKWIDGDKYVNAHGNI